MRTLTSVVVLAALAFPARAATKMDVQQLEQQLTADKGKPDADVAHELAGMEMTERLSSVKLQALQVMAPGVKTQEALELLADGSALLPPPASEVGDAAVPDGATLRTMMDQLVGYVNKTVRQLPSLTAMRETVVFEDSPAADVLGPTGITSYSYQPLHKVGETSMRVVYHDRREEVDPAEKKEVKQGTAVEGLQTVGAFGPILSTVLADAVHGKILWGRWERTAGGTEAVFKYEVPTAQSHYAVQFCCVAGGVDPNTLAQTDFHVYSTTAAYHGEIRFDAQSGTISRITAVSELQPDERVSEAGMVVEYGPVKIGGKMFVCPTKSVSVLRAHVTPQGAQSASKFTGQPKTFLNEVRFGQYHQFRAEMKIVGMEDGGGMVEGPDSAGTSRRTPTH